MFVIHSLFVSLGSIISDACVMSCHQKFVLIFQRGLKEVHSLTCWHERKLVLDMGVSSDVVHILLMLEGNMGNHAMMERCAEC